MSLAEEKKGLPVYPRKTSRSKDVSVRDTHEERGWVEDSYDEQPSERSMTFISHTHGEKVIEKKEGRRIIDDSMIPPHSVPSDILK